MNKNTPYLVAAGLIITGVVMAGASPCKLLSACGSGTDAAEACRTTTCDPAEVLVRVNGAEITRADVERELRTALGAGNQQIPDEALDEMRTQLAPRVQEMLVTQALLVGAAETENVSISESELEEAMAQVASQLPAGTNLEDLKDKLGLSDDEWTARLTRDLRIEKLLNTQLGEMENPSDAEIEAFYADHQPRLEEAGLATLEDAREAIAQQLRGQKQHDVFETYLTNLKAKATIAYPGADA